MDNRVAVLLLIGLPLLTPVIVYGFDQLSNTVKKSAGFIKVGGTLGINNIIKQSRSLSVIR